MLYSNLMEDVMNFINKYLPIAIQIIGTIFIIVIFYLLAQGLCADMGRTIR